MRLDDRLCFAQLTGRKTSGRGYGNLWREPEFCLTVRVCDVYVNSRFLPREEEQPELPVADDRGCHERNVAETAEGDSEHEPSNGKTCLNTVVRLI